MNAIPRLRPLHFFVFLLFLAGFVAFLDLGQKAVVTDNEAQRVVPPVEMLRSGDFVIPTLNGATYLAKPPLLYWAIAAVYSVTGTVSEWTGRIPTAASAVALVLLVYVLTRREMGEAAARWAALGLLASPFFIERSRWAEIDVPLTLCTFLAAVAIWRALNAASVGQAVTRTVASGLALGAAGMLKGPPAFLVVFCVWIAAVIAQGDSATPHIRKAVPWIAISLALGALFQFIPVRAPVALFVLLGTLTCVAVRRIHSERRWWTLGVLVGAVAISVAMAAPWAISVLNAKGWPYIRAMLNDQVVERTYTASAINGGPVWFYVISLVAMAAPWSLLLPLTLLPSEWRRGNGMYRFAASAGWLTVIAFSLIAGKEREYILPAFPWLFIALGLHLSRSEETTLSIGRARCFGAWYKVTLGALLVAGIAAVVFVGSIPSSSLWIRQFFLIGLALGAGLYALVRVRWPMAAVLVLTLGVTLSGVLSRDHLYSVDEGRTPRQIGDLCGTLLRAGYRVEVTPRLSARDMSPYPAVTFYAGAPIPLETDFDRVAEKFASPEPYFYLTDDKYVDVLKDLRRDREPYILVGPVTRKHTVLLGNQPLPAVDSGSANRGSDAAGGPERPSSEARAWPSPSG